MLPPGPGVRWTVVDLHHELVAGHVLADGIDAVLDGESISVVVLGHAVVRVAVVAPRSPR